MATRARMRYTGMSGFRRGAAHDVKQATGTLSNTDAMRMAARANPKLFGLNESMFPESAPDPEEVMRRQRRKLLAGMRRRSGRMSTILTGGHSGMGLG